MVEKVALVTGASRGIGEACARALAEAGYRVAIHYSTSSERAEKLATELAGSQIFKADLAVAEECSDLIRRVQKEMGRIDVLVNNAGIAIDQIITFAKADDFEKVLAVNLKAAFHLCKAISKVMIRQKGGRIINISSIVGHTGNAGQSMYAATKGAITSFSMSLAKDLASAGILVNCVAPGFIDTDMTRELPEEVRTALLKSIPLGRLGTGPEVAAAVTFLASEGASYITGTTIHVNGGMLTG
jgi:3-oxoacyl-[acyl-carrier protein] reductase